MTTLTVKDLGKFVGILLLSNLALAGETNSDELNNTLQNARAVPYVDPATGKSNGYVVDSPQTSGESNGLKIRQGDILTAVNDVQKEQVGETHAKTLDLRLGKDCKMCSVCFLKESNGHCLDKMVVVTDLDNVPFIWKCSKNPDQHLGIYVFGLNDTGLNKDKELCSYSESIQFFFQSQKQGTQIRSTLHAKKDPGHCIGIREDKQGALRAGQEVCDGSPEQHLLWVNGTTPSERIN